MIIVYRVIMEKLFNLWLVYVSFVSVEILNFAWGFGGVW